MSGLIARPSNLWSPAAPGVVTFPSGRMLRGRSLRGPEPEQQPDFGLYLTWRAPEVAWESRWVRWPDFWLPTDRNDFRQAITEAWQRAETQRIEIACGGGKGRTGTALACAAILDGVPADQAVAYIRHHYHPHAVETPWQRRMVARFTAPS